MLHPVEHTAPVLANCWQLLCEHRDQFITVAGAYTQYTSGLSTYLHRNEWIKIEPPQVNVTAKVKRLACSEWYRRK